MEKSISRYTLVFFFFRALGRLIELIIATAKMVHTSIETKAGQEKGERGVWRDPPSILSLRPIQPDGLTAGYIPEVSIHSMRRGGG